jgi:hypothetical protein
VALYWALLALGVVSWSAAGLVTIRAYGSERVPRLGSWPSGSRRRPRWAWLPFGGIFLMSFASGRLATRDDWSFIALFAGAILVSSAIQVGMIAAHNRRCAGEVAAEDEDQPAPSS